MEDVSFKSSETIIRNYSNDLFYFLEPNIGRKISMIIPKLSCVGAGGVNLIWSYVICLPEPPYETNPRVPRLSLGLFSFGRKKVDLSGWFSS